MGEYSRHIEHIWDYRIGSHWSVIIPALFILIGIIWFFTVYRPGKFRFLPALAIARVTIMDSIGRLEVIILLIIGMLIVGINGIIPNTALGRTTLEGIIEGIPFIDEKLGELTTSADVFLDEGDIITMPGADLTGQLSGVEGEFGQYSIGGGENLPPSDFHGQPSIYDNDIGGQGPAEQDAVLTSTETELSGEAGSVVLPDGSSITPEEREVIARQKTLTNLIWHGAFLVADFFVAMIGFVLAMMVLPNEMNRGVTLSILPKPITRSEYVIGKALGIWAIVSGCFIALAAELYLIHLIFLLFGTRSPIDLHYLEAVMLFPVKYFTMVIIIMGLTLRMPEVPAGIIGAAIYTGGHFAEKIIEFTEIDNLHWIFNIGLKFAYWVLPHLSQVTVNILDKDMTLIENWNMRWGWLWQIGIYNIVFLWLLCWLFKRRSL